MTMSRISDAQRIEQRLQVATIGAGSLYREGDRAGWSLGGGVCILHVMSPWSSVVRCDGPHIIASCYDTPRRYWRVTLRSACQVERLTG